MKFTIEKPGHTLTADDVRLTFDKLAKAFAGYGLHMTSIACDISFVDDYGNEADLVKEQKPAIEVESDLPAAHSEQPTEPAKFTPV